jgi:Big-like domain-containing protein/Calx-beta domain-containing protein
VAVNDSATTNEDLAVNIPVLMNDTDIDTGDTKLVASVTQGAKGTVTVNADQTVKYTPAANANGTDTFTYKAKDAAGALSNSATVTVTITAVNDAPSFTKGANPPTSGAGAKTVTGWATAISAGPADEVAQTLTFTVTNNNNALFTVQPAVAANGTLTYTLGSATGTATVTVTLKDNGGTANGGVDTSAAQTFTITAAATTVFATSTSLTVSSNPLPFGATLTLKATVVGAAGSTGVPTGTVTFKDGATTIGTATLSAGVATMTTATLAVGTHSLTAVYGGGGGFTGSTSAAVSEVINTSATLKVAFNVLALQDNTSKPVVKTIPVPNALVKVFQTNNSCVGTLFNSIDPKKWGRIFDGADGVGGVDGCAPVTVGSYQATGTTDASGVTSIRVPPLALSLTNTYIVIARATNFDYVKTATSPDPLYSAFPVLVAPANTTLNVPLFLMATFNGTIVPATQTQFYGSYLDIIQPEYMDWTREQEQYPFVLIAEGDWSVSTSVAPPSGFVPDATTLATLAADQTTTALQFTLTDVGSDWTETGVTHVINHKGETKVAKSSVKMFNRRPTKAKADAWSVMTNSGATTIPVLHNDVVAPPKTLTVTGVTSAPHGTVTFTADAVSYTPNADFSGLDTFTYTIVDSEGVESSAEVKVRVGTRPNIFINDVTVTEGAKGTMTTALFTVNLSGALEIPVTFDYTTHDGTAVSAGGPDDDYAAAAGTLEFAPGETSKTIAVQVIGDGVREPNEKFTVELLNVLNASVVFGKGVGTILNDDQWPALSASDVSVVEGNNAVVTVSVDGDFRDPITVEYVTVDGTAVAGVDYTAASGTLTIAPGSTSATITVAIPGDSVAEKNKTFRVRLQNPVNARLATAAAGVVTIVDDDR